jgi:DUF4097 and DUF4098 domain-containing protein YvlB
MRTAILAVPLLLAACGVKITTAGESTGFGAMPGLDASALKTEEAALEIKAGDVIDAASDFGAVRLRVDDAAKPSARATITVRAKTDEDAQRVLATWKLVVTRSGNVVRLRAEGEKLETEIGGGKTKVAPQVELEAVVPAGVKAVANSQSGDIRAEGAFAGAELKTSFGKVVVSGTRGELSAKTQSGEVTVQDVQGASVEARSAFGAVRLRKVVSPKVVGHSQSGDVSCEAEGKGDYELTTQFGGVRMDGGNGTLLAKTQSGSVDVAFDGKVTARSEFGNVEVKGVLSAVEASSQSGSVEVEADAGSKAAASWTVKSSFGGVALRVPEAFACELTLATQFGKLVAEHPGLARGPDKGAKEMSAKVGAGGESVTVKTQSGAARFERSSR